jgi:hypothetical protein
LAGKCGYDLWRPIIRRWVGKRDDSKGGQAKQRANTFQGMRITHGQGLREKGATRQLLWTTGDEIKRAQGTGKTIPLAAGSIPRRNAGEPAK